MVSSLLIAFNLFIGARSLRHRFQDSGVQSSKFKCSRFKVQGSRWEDKSFSSGLDVTFLSFPYYKGRELFRKAIKSGTIRCFCRNVLKYDNRGCTTYYKPRRGLYN